MQTPGIPGSFETFHMICYAACIRLPTVRFDIGVHLADDACVRPSPKAARFSIITFEYKQFTSVQDANYRAWMARTQREGALLHSQAILPLLQHVSIVGSCCAIH